MRGRGVRAEGIEKMGEEIHFNAITANSLYAPCPLLYAQRITSPNQAQAF